METSIVLDPCKSADIDLSNYRLIADNGGGIQLVWGNGTSDYIHHYDSPEALAEDIASALLEEIEPGDWDGNDLTGDDEEDAELMRGTVYDPEMERNGGARWYRLDESIPAGESAWGHAMTILCDSLVKRLADAGRLDMVSVFNG